MPTGFMIGLLASTAIVAPFALRAAASANIGYTTIQGGEGKIVVAGGDFVRAIISFPGHHINDPNKRWCYDSKMPAWEILENDPALPFDYYDDRNPFTKYVGGHWVGIPGLRSVYSYVFEWSEQQLDQEGATVEVGAYKIRARSEDTDHFICNDFPYIIVDKDARTKGNVPVVIIYQLTLRINNPKKAFFETDDWMQTISGLTNGEARNFIGEFTPEQLLSNTDETNPALRDKENFTKRIIDLKLMMPRDKLEPPSDPSRFGTSGRYGVTPVAAEMLAIMPAGEAGAAVIEALTAEFRAQREALAEKARGQGIADFTRLTKAAEADGIRMVKAAEADGILKTEGATARGRLANIAAMEKNPRLAALLLGTKALEGAGTKWVVGGGSVANDVVGTFLERVSPKPTPPPVKAPEGEKTDA